METTVILLLVNKYSEFLVWNIIYKETVHYQTFE